MGRVGDGRLQGDPAGPEREVPGGAWRAVGVRNENGCGGPGTGARGEGRSRRGHAFGARLPPIH